MQGLSRGSGTLISDAYFLSSGAWADVLLSTNCLRAAFICATSCGVGRGIVTCGGTGAGGPGGTNGPRPNPPRPRPTPLGGAVLDAGCVVCAKTVPVWANSARLNAITAMIFHRFTCASIQLFVVNMMTVLMRVDGTRCIVGQ